MPRYLCLASIVFVCGCSTDNRPKSDMESTGAASSAKAVASVAPSLLEKGSSESPSNSKLDNTSLSPSDSATSAGQLAPHPMAEGQRFLLLGPDGPILVELRIEIQRKNSKGWYAGLIQSASNAADSNGDGNINLVELKQFVDGIGELKTFFDEIKDQIDSNENDIVDLDELVGVLTRDAGQGGFLRFQSSPSYDELRRWESATVSRLNVDADSRLSPEELSTAPDVLWKYDFDDDEVLTLDELADLPATDEPALTMAVDATSAADPETALLLHPTRGWIRNLFSLQRHYGHRGRLRLSAFDHRPALLSELDVDGNDRITEQELEAAYQIEPQIRLVAAFSDVDTTEPQLIVEPLENAWTLVNGPVHRHRLSSDRMVVMFQSDDQLASQGRSDDWLERVTSNRVQLVVTQHVDSLFSLLDQNMDDRLSSREISVSTDRLTRLDKNADGAVTSDEIPVSMSVQISRGVDVSPTELATTAQPRSSTTDQSADPTVPGWFRGMDTNQDGDLSRREFLGTEDQFDHLDQDGNGFLQKAEVAND